ncbi:extracellular solute-binding protein [Paenibacillus sp. P26]|nr:extracellular solute-binding protein [Paenibacillus sp. P26]
MNKRKVQIGSALLSTTLIASALAGCTSGGGDKSGSAPAPAGQTQSASAGKIDTSKKVELQFYMLGDAPKDLPVIQDEINKLAEKDLNATIKFNYTSWTDWEQKYKPLLSSGQQVDLIFTAEWTQYQSYAKRGAFQPLDESLPKAAPELAKFVPKEMWDAVKIDGKIYTVPATYKEYVTNGFVYREDLREKYNLPKPTSIETYEAYLDGIKKNEPDMFPLSYTSDPTNNMINPYRELVHDSIASPRPTELGFGTVSPRRFTRTGARMSSFRI